MPFTCQPCLRAVIMLSLIANGAFAQLAFRSSDSIFIDNYLQRLLDYQQDFLDFAKNNQGVNPFEYQIAYDFYCTTSQEFERLDAVKSLLCLYNMIECKSDKFRSSNYIKSKINGYSLTIAVSFSSINLGLSGTSSPGIATTGTKLKDDLRALQSFFKSFKL